MFKQIYNEKYLENDPSTEFIEYYLQIDCDISALFDDRLH